MCDGVNDVPGVVHLKRALIDDALWFLHQDGGRFYPWLRFSKHHQQRSFWVSDGSNLIRDAIPVPTIEGLVVEVFARGRCVWLFDGGKRGGLYRFGHGVIQSWDATPSVRAAALRSGAPSPASP